MKKRDLSNVFLGFFIIVIIICGVWLADYYLGPREGQKRADDTVTVTDTDISVENNNPGNEQGITNPEAWQNMPSGVAEELNQEENSGQTIEKKILISQRTAEPGDTVTYTPDGYTPEDIVSTAWYAGYDKRLSGAGMISYTVKPEDTEKIISYRVETSDGKHHTGALYCTDIPVLYIESSVPYSAYAEKTESYTDVSVVLAAKGSSEDKLYDGEAGLRLRGNSTAGLAKKPFKLKLDEKADLLGMGKNKHWVLLANAIDVTNMRNKLLYDFAGEIGAEFYMQSENVALVYNGQYMGVYQLCEQIRIGDNRVEIYNWEDMSEDIAGAYLEALTENGVITREQAEEVKGDVEDELKNDYIWMSEPHVFFSEAIASINPDMNRYVILTDYVDFEKAGVRKATGGVLVEMDFYAGENADLRTAYKQPYYFNTPENGADFDELHDYMKEYIQTVEYALHDTDFIYNNSDVHCINADEGVYDRERKERIGVRYETDTSFTSVYEGKHYTELLDMNSAVVNFLVCEFSRNWDSMKNSAFMYKDTEGLLKLGPAWDFDWAWGNSMYGINTDFPKGWQTTDDYFACEQYYQTNQWNRYLIRDPYFLVKVYEKYHEIRGTVIEDYVKTGGIIDAYTEKYRQASLANDMVWGGSLGTYYGARYDSEVTRLKQFVLTRVSWLDKQFTSIEALRKSTGYYVTSDKICVDSVVSDSGCVNITASCELDNAAAVSFQVNGICMVTAGLENGVAEVSIPYSDTEDGLDGLNVVQVRALDGAGNYIIQDAGSIKGEYSNAVSAYAVFY